MAHSWKGDSQPLRACLNVLNSPCFWVSDCFSVTISVMLSKSAHRNLAREPSLSQPPSVALNLPYSRAPQKPLSLFPVP